MNKNSKGSTSKLTATAGALLGATLSTLGVMADPVEVYNENGLILQLENGPEGQMKLVVENQTDEDMHDVVLTNQEIEGLELSEKEIKLGRVEAGEVREVDFKYFLDEASAEIVDEVVKESEKDKDEEKDKDKKPGSTDADKTDNKPGKDKDGNQKVQTSDESSSGVLKIAIPVTVAGVAGLLVIFAIKKDKKASKNTLALLIGAGALGTAMFGANTTFSALEGDKINPETGRIQMELPIQGTTIVDGEEYEYAGTFYFENDHVVTQMEDVVIPIDVVITEDNELEVGSYKVTQSDVEEGMQKMELTYVNGVLVSSVPAADAIPAVDYEVTIGTKPVSKEDSIEFVTRYSAIKDKEIGHEEVLVEGEEGVLTTTTTLSDELDNFKDKVLSGKVKGDGVDAMLTKDVEETTKEPVTHVIGKGTMSTKDYTIVMPVEYTADNDKEIVGKPTDKENFTVTSEGANGLGRNYFSQEVDNVTGELLPELTLDKTTEVTPATTEFVSVAAKEVASVAVPFETIYKDLEDVWVGTENVTTVGVDGENKVTYNYAINPDTGIHGEKTIVNVLEVSEPTIQVIERGVKTHDLVQETKKEAVPFDKDRSEFIDDISKVNTREKFDALKAEFDALADGQEEIISIEGVEGEATFNRTVAVDEEGKYYTPIEPTDWVEDTSLFVAPKTQSSVYFNAYVNHENAIPFEVEYIADDSAFYGEETVIREGKEGKSFNVSLVKAGEPTLTVNFKAEEPVSKQVLVGTRKTTATQVDFEKIVVEDDTKWDNYKEVTTPGKKGDRVTVTIHEVNPETGELHSPTLISDEIINEPIAEVTTVGTKKPDWVNRRETEVIEHGAPETLKFVSNSKFKALKTTNDYKALLQSFVALRDAADAEDVIDELTFVSRYASNGEVGFVYNVAIDPDTGLEVPGYEKQLVETVNVDAVNEQRTFFNLQTGPNRNVGGTYTYKANGQLGFKEEKVIQEAVLGKQVAIDMDGLERVWVDDVDNMGQAGVKEIGNIEKVTTEYHADARVVNDYWRFLDETITVGGKAGLKEETFKYNVNATTGKLSGKTSTGSRVIEEAEAATTYKGSLEKVGKLYSSDIVANGFMEALNAERNAAGRGSLVRASSAVTKGGIHINDTTSRHASSMIASRMAVGFSGLDHQGFGSDDVISNAHLSKFDTGVAREEMVLDQVLDLFTSSAHYNILVNNDDTKIVFSMWEVDTPSGLWVVFVASTGN